MRRGISSQGRPFWDCCLQLPETPASAIEEAEATAQTATEKQVAPAETKKLKEASKPLNVGSLQKSLYQLQIRQS